MSPAERRVFRIREFAQMAGVTVRALHHYDRLGLLTPARTAAGYRAYTTDDLAVLEQVVALKFIGVPLKQIRALRRAAAAALADALRAQRQTLEEKRRLLDQAIGAIRDGEAALRAGTAPQAAIFKRIIEVIEMQNDNANWAEKYDTLVQAKVARLQSLSPEALADLRKDWGVLVSDIQEALGDDPAGPAAQALADRWIHLLGQLMGGPVPSSMLGVAAARTSFGDWSPRMASFADKRVWDFIQKAMAARA